MSEWIFHSLAASTMLMLAVMAVRPWVSLRWGPRLAYALWLLPLVRLLCPPLPVLPGGVVTETAFDAVQAPVYGLDSLSLIFALWLAGACIFLTMQLRAYRQVLVAARRAQVGPANRLGAITVVRSAAVEAPFAAGLIRRSIFVPADFDETFDDAERRLVLAHETAHHHRGDLWANLLGLLVLSAHWFNPIAHRGHRLYRVDQELACDADVLALHGGERFSYGRTLVKASGGLPAALCALSDAAMLKLRLSRMAVAVEPRGGPLTIAGVLTAGLALAGGTAAVTGPALVLAGQPEFRFAPQPLEVGPVAVAPRRAPPADRAASVADQPSPKVTVAPPQARPSLVEPAALSERLIDDPAYLARRRVEGLAQRRTGARDAREPSSPIERAALRGHPVGDPAYLARRIAQGLERSRSSG